MRLAGVDAQRRQALRPRLQPRQVPERLPVSLAAQPRCTLGAGLLKETVLPQNSQVPLARVYCLGLSRPCLCTSRRAESQKVSLLPLLRASLASLAR